MRLMLLGNRIPTDSKRARSSFGAFPPGSLCLLATPKLASPVILLRLSEACPSAPDCPQNCHYPSRDGPPMEPREVFVRIHLDTNRINARGRLPAVNQLERWHEDGVIELFMSETAHSEARKGGDERRTEKALGYIYSYSAITASEELETLRAIEVILSSDKVPSADIRNDAAIVFNAGKYCAILVTADGGSRSQPGGILGHRSELTHISGARIMTDAEAVAHVRAKIASRDEICRMQARYESVPLPEWVGRD
jgi:hypothetical protein